MLNTYHNFMTIAKIKRGIATLTPSPSLAAVTSITHVFVYIYIEYDWE